MRRRSSYMTYYDKFAKKKIPRSTQYSRKKRQEIVAQKSSKESPNIITVSL